MPEESHGESRSEGYDKDWKLKLRYGRLVTLYKHFTAIANGIAGDLPASFNCRPGPAVMAMRMWATDPEQAPRMMLAVADQLGFAVKGKLEIYKTDPEQPPGEHPSGYGICFIPHNGD